MLPRLYVSLCLLADTACAPKEKSSLIPHVRPEIADPPMSSDQAVPCLLVPYKGQTRDYTLAYARFERGRPSQESERAERVLQIANTVHFSTLSTRVALCETGHPESLALTRSTPPA